MCTPPSCHQYRGGNIEIVPHLLRRRNTNESDNIVCLGKVVGKLEGEYEIIND